MSTRKIKDAKDISTNELIYFKGHAKATTMSDGRTVEDAIKNISESSIAEDMYPDANVKAIDTNDSIDGVDVSYATIAYVDSLIGDINNVLGGYNIAFPLSILEGENGVVGVSLFNYLLENYNNYSGVVPDGVSIFINGQHSGNVTHIFVYSDKIGLKVGGAYLHYLKESGLLQYDSHEVEVE